MQERMADNTPRIIRRLYDFPYIFFPSLGTSILDIASGFPRWEILREYYDPVICLDAMPLESGVSYGDILDIPLPDNSIDTIFCFETIEHIEGKDQKRAIEELARVAHRRIVIGTVNRTGPDWIKGVVIYKGVLNPFHLNELSTMEFADLFRQVEADKKFYGAFYDRPSNKLSMREGLHPNSYGNYIDIRLDKE